MKEVNAKNDEVVSLSHQRCGQDRTIQYTEAELRNAQARLYTEAQQRNMAMEMAKEAITGQAEVLKQNEQLGMEKTAQFSRLERAVHFANERISQLEGVLGETKQHSEEATQLLSGSASGVYSLACEAMQLRGVISKQEEEMQYASIVHEDMSKTWTQLSGVHTLLRAQIGSMSLVHSLEQHDSSMRSPEDASLRVELAASLARESTVGNELQTTRFEVQQLVSETHAQRRLSANEMQIMRGEYLRSKSEFSEVGSFSRQLEKSWVLPRNRLRPGRMSVD